jgi:hypothetical protein
LPAAFLGLALAASSALAAGEQVDVARHGASFEVQAEAYVAAPIALAWATVTDYESLPTFVPDVRSSRVLERSRDGSVERLTLEQRGELRFLFFARPIAVRLQVEQQAPTSVVARHLPGGNGSDELRSFNGSYLLRGDGNGTTLSYRATIEPGFDLPPFVGTLLMRHTIHTQFHALVAEIERRATVAGAVVR